MVSKAFKLAAIAKNTSIDGILGQNAAPSLLTTYATFESLPLSGNQEGDMVFVANSNSLYVYTDNGWYSCTIINDSVIITSQYVSEYTLIPGEAVVKTLTASDPEGYPITWSYTVTSGSLGDTIVTQNDNVFTITPGQTNNTEFELTFTATDGVTSDSTTSSFQFGTDMERASLAYANSIAAATGGQVIVHNPAVSGTDLTYVLGDYNGGSPASPPLPALSNGDVLYLLPGNYTTTSWKTTYSASIFPRGHYSVVGADPQNTSIFVDYNGGSPLNPAPRAESFFSWDENGAAPATYGTVQLNVGFVTLIQQTFGGTTNYQVPIFHGLGTSLDYITLRNVALNRYGSNASWLYDNSGDQGTVKLERCTIFNTGTWYTNYSGSKVNKTFTDGLTSSATSFVTTNLNTSNVTTGVTVTVDGFYGTYDTTTYADKGHLFLDNNSSNYTEPTAFG
jgi:hypothetical protein